MSLRTPAPVAAAHPRVALIAALFATGFACEAIAPVDGSIATDPDGGGPSTPGVDSDTDGSPLPGTSGGGASNNPPRANAGVDQRDIVPGTFVNLDGEGDDLDGDTLTYQWTIASKPSTSATAIIENADFPAATLYVDVPGEFVVALTVNDGKATDDDTVKITVIPDNLPPIANAGFDQPSVCIGSQVTLDGGASFDQDPQNPGQPISGSPVLKYFWTMRSSPGTRQLFGTQPESGAVRPYFIPDRSGLYTVELKVEDEDGLQSAPDTVSITARDCSGGSSGGSSSSSSGSDCLSCAADTMTASAAPFRTGGVASSLGVLTLPFFVLLWQRRRDDD